MSYHELTFRFQDQLRKVPPPGNAKIPGARVMTGSREEAIILLRARHLLWEMDDLQGAKRPHQTLWDQWQRYSDFWEEKSLEPSISVDLE